MQCQGRRTPSMKASYVAMTKGSSTDLTKDFIKQEYTSSYSQPSTPAVTTDGGAGRSQRQKKYVLIFLACMFRRKGRAIVNARLSSLSSLCKNFNVAHYSKSIEGIKTRLAHFDKMLSQDKWHNSESYGFELCPFFQLIVLSRMMAPDRIISVGTACGAFVIFYNFTALLPILPITVVIMCKVTQYICHATLPSESKQDSLSFKFCG